MRGLRTLASAFAVVVCASCGRLEFAPQPDAAISPVDHNAVVTLGDVGDDAAVVVTRNAIGNLVIGGRFSGVVDFGCGAATSAGGLDGFAIEFTPELSCAYTWIAGGMGDDRVDDIAIDGLGNIVIGGEFRMTSQIAGASLVATFQRDIFLAKLTASWQPVWARQAQGNDNDPGYELVGEVGADSTGGVYVFGRLWGTVQFGWDGVTQMFTDTGWGDLFVMRVSADGQYGGTDMFGGGGGDHPTGMALDAADNLYIGGVYRGDADFDPGPGVTMFNSGPSHDGFIERRNPDGSLAWVTAHQNGYWNPYAAIAIAPNLGLCTVRNDWFPNTPDITVRTLALDPADGRVLWSKDFIAANIYATSIDADDDGNSYVAGWYYDTVDFDPEAGEDLRTSFGGADCFIQSYAPDGTRRWTMTFGGAGSDSCDGIIALGPDDVVVVGFFQNDVNFGTDEKPDIRQARGGGDIFVRRIVR